MAFCPTTPDIRPRLANAGTLQDAVPLLYCIGMLQWSAPTFEEVPLNAEVGGYQGETDPIPRLTASE